MTEDSNPAPPPHADGDAASAPPAEERAVPERALPAFVPDFFAYPQRPFLTLVAGWLLAILGAFAIAATLAMIVPEAQAPDFDAFVGKGWFSVIAIAVVTPFIETLILAVTVLVMLRYIPTIQAILLSAFGWAIVHSLSAPIWGLVIFWPFVIFTTLFVVWRQRSFLWGFAMAWGVHVMQNFLPSLTIGFPDQVPSILG